MLVSFWLRCRRSLGNWKKEEEYRKVPQMLLANEQIYPQPTHQKMKANVLHALEYAPWATQQEHTIIWNGLFAARLDSIALAAGL